MEQKKNKYLSDLYRAVKYGILLAVFCSVLLLAGGFFFRRFSLYQAISTWRSGMCVLSAFALFLVAGTILMKKNKQIESDSQWRKKFYKLSYGSVIGMIAVIFILCAALSDAVLLFIV